MEEISPRGIEGLGEDQIQALVQAIGIINPKLEKQMPATKGGPIFVSSSELPVKLSTQALMALMGMYVDQGGFRLTLRNHDFAGERWSLSFIAPDSPVQFKDPIEVVGMD